MRTLATYTIQVIAPEESPAEEGSAFGLEQQEKRVLADLPAAIEEMQENLTDVLPEGFRAEIRTWNSVGPNEVEE